MFEILCLQNNLYVLFFFNKCWLHLYSKFVQFCYRVLNVSKMLEHFLCVINFLILGALQGTVRAAANKRHTSCHRANAQEFCSAHEATWFWCRSCWRCGLRPKSSQLSVIECHVYYQQKIEIKTNYEAQLKI